MEHLRLELSSEQTLRLEELRQTLAEVLPPDVAKMVEFPTAHYATCGSTCFFACDGTCFPSCWGTCWLSCKDRCDFSCQAECMSRAH